MFSLKSMNFCVLNFADQHCLNCSGIYFRDLSKKSQNLNPVSVCVCPCVRVCVRVCVCVCTCDEISKVHKMKILKSYHLYTTRNFTCLKCCYISWSIKILHTLKQSWTRVFIWTADLFKCA